MLKRLSRYACVEKLKVLTDSLSTSILTFAMPVYVNTWGMTSLREQEARRQAFTKDDCRRLQVLQNKVLRLQLPHVCSNNINMSTDALVKAAGCLSVHQLGA